MDEKGSISSQGSAVPKANEDDFEPKPVTKKESWFRRHGTASGAVTTAENDVDASRFENAKRLLCERLTGRQGFADTTKNAAWHWYLNFLDSRLDQCWEHVASKVLQGVSAVYGARAIQSRTKAYEVLAQLAAYVEHEQEISLLTMVARLQSRHLIREDAGELAVQLVFQFTGWLTALWDPSTSTSTLELTLFEGCHRPRRRLALQKPVIRDTALHIHEARQPLHRFATRFGELLPVPELVLRNDAEGGVEAGLDTLRPAYLSFHSLQDVLNLEIEWTATLNQHLEYDETKSKLRVFSHPSLCYLMYRDVDGSLLSRVFLEHQKEERDHVSEDCKSHLLRLDAAVEDFLAEFLLSYRLIFAHFPRSRKKIARALKGLKERHLVGGIDPLLELLCTEVDTTSKIVQLNKELEWGNTRTGYISIQKFPFLGPRLAHLQRLSLGQSPHSFRRVWRDTRSPVAWFGIWAAVIFGSLAIVLALLQLVFQIFQVWTP